MFLGHFVQAGLEGIVLCLASGEFFGAFIGHQVENVFVKDEAIAGHFAAVSECFEAGDDAGPFDKVGIGIVLVEFPPADDSGLLEHFIGIGSGGEERADEAAEVGFMVGEALDEKFVAIVFGDGLWRCFGHSLLQGYFRWVGNLTGRIHETGIFR